MQILLKFLISFIIVFTLAEISKRINPFFGGLLSGLPLGTGIAVYFIAREQGINFVMKGIPWGIAGLSSSILFCLFYFFASKFIKNKSTILNIALNSLFAVIFFVISGFILWKLKLNLIIGITIFIIIAITNIFILSKFRITNIKSRNKNNSISVLLFRGLFVGLIIIIITGIAKIIGPKWAGILSAFPSTLYALIIVLHYEDNEKLYPSVIKGFSYSVTTLAVFYLLCFVFLEKFQLNIAYLVIYLLSILYLTCFNLLRKKFFVNIKS